MKSILAKILALGYLIGLPALANNVGLHNSSAQPTLAISTGEELMFIMDVPYVPVQETPVVLAQTTAQVAGNNAQQPDYILKVCQETESTGDSMSAIRSIDPAGMLYLYFQNYRNREIDLSMIKTTLLEGAKHGEISSGITNYGRTAYGYDPQPDYVGKDRAIFIAEFEGKSYKIEVNLVVSIMVDENMPVCPQPKLIKVKKPASGSSGYEMNPVSVSFTALDSTRRLGFVFKPNVYRDRWVTLC